MSDSKITLRSILSEFYNKDMAQIIAVIWIVALIAIAGAVWAAVKFFDTDSTKCQILFAALFLSFAQMLYMMKIFAWQMIHRNSIKKDIAELRKQLEAIKQ